MVLAGQYGKGFSVLATGLGIVPLTIPVILGGRHAGRLAQRIGLDATIALAFAFAGGGLLGLSTSGPATPYVVYALWLVVNGAGVMLAARGQGGAVIRTFVAGADLGLRVVGVAVLVLGGLVVLQSRVSRRRLRRPADAPTG